MGLIRVSKWGQWVGCQQNYDAEECPSWMSSWSVDDQLLLLEYNTLARRTRAPNERMNGNESHKIFKSGRGEILIYGTLHECASIYSRTQRQQAVGK